jgi:diguanylate cyclase (GGDEF)-like protein
VGTDKRPDRPHKGGTLSLHQGRNGTAAHALLEGASSIGRPSDGHGRALRVTPLLAIAAVAFVAMLAVARHGDLVLAGLLLLIAGAVGLTVHRLVLAARADVAESRSILQSAQESVISLAHQAMHDALTGLPNRVLFNDRMRQARARLSRGGSLALLFLDLDHFKVVNDELGHDAGDLLLHQAGRRLGRVLRPTDTVARFGGDEFAVLCEGADCAEAEAIAARIGEAFAPPFAVGGHEVTMSVSTGVVCTVDAAMHVDDLLSDADTAMYAAKRAGRARYVVFASEMRGRRRGRFRLSEGRSTELSLDALPR